MFVESDPAHPPLIFSPFGKTGRGVGSDPHVGIDIIVQNQGQVNGGHPYLLSPIDGQIIQFQPSYSDQEAAK
jgi:hypothetical protein